MEDSQRRAKRRVGYNDLISNKRNAQLFSLTRIGYDIYGQW
jgi:hypothetical protein